MTRRGFRHSPVHEKGNAWIKLCQLVMYPIAFLSGRKKFIGQEHIAVPGPVLVVANHISHIDPVYDAVMLRQTGRLPHIMAKASLWKVPVIGRAMRATGQIPVERGKGQGQAGLAAAVQTLADGGLVLIYPDGTVSRDPGRWPMRPRPGVAVLALSGDFPVIPMAHWGTHEVFRPYVGKGAYRPLPRKDVHVVAGPPIDLSAYRNLPVDARLIRDVSYVIQGAIRDLLAEVRHEVPPEQFFDPKRAERTGRTARTDGAVTGPTGAARATKATEATGTAAQAGRADGPDGSDR